jgi:hypothetical protein
MRAKTVSKVRRARIGRFMRRRVTEKKFRSDP